MTPRRRALALLLVPVAVPLAALAAGGDRASVRQAPAGTVMVAEQVSAARNVVPFGVSAEGGTRTVWATGATRAASTMAGQEVVPPAAGTPAQTMLLQGTIAGDSQATAWQRALPPLDRDGAPLPAGGWRIDDGSAAAGTDATAGGDALHAGAVTPSGAAALLVRIAGSGGPRAAVLARTADGRLRELPAPAPELLDPLPDAFAAPAGSATPMAVFDAPADPGAPELGRTGVLLAPAGGDGVLRWDGTSWSEEPWHDADGEPVGARTALALGATPAGDAIALFDGDASAPDADRLTLARRDPGDPDEDQDPAFAPVAVTGSRLLGGPLPAGIASIQPVRAPGQPLTVAEGHWWLDLVVTRADSAAVSAAIHVAPAAAGDDPAEATATWCSPALPAETGCTRDLGFGLAVVGGYRSQAFADPALPFGRRALTRPVIPEATGDPAIREASASGGYLELEDDAFRLRAGPGDDGTAGTHPGAFAPDGFAVIGGARTVGRTMAGRQPAFAAYEASTSAGADANVDIALSPPGTPLADRGAIAVTPSGTMLRRRGDEPWELLLFEEGGGLGTSRAFGLISAAAWDRPGSLIVAGSGGLLAEIRLATLTRRPEAALETGTAVTEAAGLSFADVAALGDDAWAVGREGAAMHRSGGAWTRVELSGPLAGAHLRQVAYAGGVALVASDRGLLTATAGGELVRDEELAALMAADGRPVAAAAVAGLPDGAAVVDGRYVRDVVGAPWRRLASPAEGDVAALAVWRDAGPGALLAPEGASPPAGTTLRIAASIGDAARPLYGAPIDIEFGEEDGDGGGGAFQIEGQTLPRDGRLALLGPDGWRDAIGAPLSRSLGRDLAAWSPAVSALAVDERGTGWAVGGAGTLFDLFSNSASSAPRSFELPLGATVPDRAVEAADPASPARPGPGDPPRIYVGGHPACIGECAGRDDQGVAPDVTLRNALRTAAGLATPATGPTVVVIGGGRAAVGGTPLTVAGARRYAALLRSEPSLTVAAAIGTGDAQTAESRRAFRTELAALFHRGPAAPGGVQPVTNPPAPIDDPASDVVAYAFDIPHAGLTAAGRVVVIDNAGGSLRGGMNGPQAAWIRAVLTDAGRSGLPTVVVGAARLDDSQRAAADREEELALLAESGAPTYVATDGVDDASSSAFGHRTSFDLEPVGDTTLRLYRASALGHGRTVRDLFQADEPAEFEERFFESPALLGLDLSGDPRVPSYAQTIPVFTRFATRTVTAERGVAGTVAIAAESGAGTGFLWQDPAAPGTPPVEARGYDQLDVGVPFCQVFVDEGSCERIPELRARYAVADPTVAVFVTARRAGSGDVAPEILIDGSGNPVVSPVSPVLCPLRPGRTTVTVSVSGRAATLPLVVTESTAPPPATGRPPCAFRGGEPTAMRPAPPAVPPPAAPAPPPAPTAAPPPSPAPAPAPAPSAPPPAPAPAVQPPAAAPPAAPALFVPLLATGGAVPPVAPNPKPAPTPPPATPTGLNAQVAPAQQVAPQAQLSPARQAQRQQELAREGAIHQATVYEPARDGGAAGAIAAGAGLVLAAGALGGVVGHRRRVAQAAARRWLA